MNHAINPIRQTGAVLAVTLIMLLLLTLIGISSMQTTSLEEKMTGNLRDKDLAFQAAESALAAAEASIDPAAAYSNAGTNGLYSKDSTIPTATAVLTDKFWTDGLANNTVATSAINTLGNGIKAPVYIIQALDSADCPSAAVGSLGCKNYRIVVRATGGSTNAVVILQSYYLR